MSWLQWGDVPSVANAIFTAGALIFAGLAAKSASGQLKELKEESQRKEEDRKKEQAGQVNVWIDRRESGEFAGHYSNLSGAPVYNVTIDIFGPQFVGHDRKPVLAPSTGPVEVRRVTEVLNEMAERDPMFTKSWSAASSKIEIVPSSKQSSSPYSQEMELIIPVGLTVTFTDTKNRRWHRKISGELFPVTERFRTVSETKEDGPIADKDQTEG